MYRIGRAQKHDVSNHSKDERNEECKHAQGYVILVEVVGMKVVHGLGTRSWQKPLMACAT